MELQPPPSQGGSARTSRAHRSSPSSTFLDEIKHEVMVNYLYQQQCAQLWVGEGRGEVEGCLLRKTRNTYLACPPQLGHSALATACAHLQVQGALTVNSRVIKTFLQWSPDAVDVPLLNGLRIQILPTLADLPRARKHQFAAFVAAEALLIVWDDDALNLLPRAKAIEAELMEQVWQTGPPDAAAQREPQLAVRDWDEERGAGIPETRPVHLQNSVLVAGTVILIMTVLGAGARQIAMETEVDGSYLRLALLALTPIQIFFTLFFAQVIIGCLAQLFGPIRQMHTNSKFFSARAPPRTPRARRPHITIQCPVYKEGLRSVIAPTVKSIQQAISTYELQGGSANLLVNDDGLQLLDEAERRARIDFYADHSIGWTARPQHGDHQEIDSDTRVPADCLLDAGSEMDQSPEVGIMQFSSGVMQVVHTYFENGITFFTHLIYAAIRYTVANGDVAPFVGHNAILRWSAIQQVSYQDEDGYEKFWSESHVSEDFDMSLRLQCSGYTIRLAAWAGDGFQEGVSLTVYDELARWEKYAYGCNELLFHPLLEWLGKGPFTPLCRAFLCSDIRFTSKITIVAYMGTYYAIGAAWIMTTANYFAIGWFNGYLDQYYVDSWKRSLLDSLGENVRWTVMLAIFLGGLSLHVSQALLAHMFRIDMTWGATSKEAEFSNFFIEVPKVLKKFWGSMVFSLVGIAGMVVLSTDLVPDDWQITDFVAILPMATITASHLLLPLALNPALMTFSW
ncbi:hypothetical protein BUE80_DR006943 [Diplocarpon rosae]|nr:hypothetical protein BUE80_DR006943 [Diplocarpon rosae]